MAEMSPKKERASEILIEIEAVHCNVADPFVLTSGWRSPVYIDCRKLISPVDQRREIIDMMVERIRTAVGDDGIDVIAGGETAGIPFAAWVSEAMSLPMIYVRKKPKAGGRVTMRLGDLSRLAPLIPALARVAGTLDAEIATTRPVAIPLETRALGELLRRGGGVTASLRADTEIAGKRLRGEIDAALDAGPDKATLTLRADAPDAGVTGGMTLAIADPQNSVVV